MLPDAGPDGLALANVNLPVFLLRRDARLGEGVGYSRQIVKISVRAKDSTPTALKLVPFPLTDSSTAFETGAF